jgi:hypothetical protein
MSPSNLVVVIALSAWLAGFVLFYIQDTRLAIRKALTMYTLCMHGGPHDGREVLYDDAPSEFRLPDPFDSRLITQFNTFPTVPCHVYRREAGRICAKSPAHVYYAYYGHENGKEALR